MTLYLCPVENGTTYANPTYAMVATEQYQEALKVLKP